MLSQLRSLLLGLAGNPELRPAEGVIAQALSDHWSQPDTIGRDRALIVADLHHG
ncbi:MAG: hypothetical protein V3T07_00670 [Myxococcota bacterium]|nr:hypothetical protein [Planctomycetota bacterium]